MSITGGVSIALTAIHCVYHWRMSFHINTNSSVRQDSLIATDESDDFVGLVSHSVCLARKELAHIMAIRLFQSVSSHTKKA